MLFRSLRKCCQLSPLRRPRLAGEPLSLSVVAWPVNLPLRLIPQSTQISSQLVKTACKTKMATKRPQNATCLHKVNQAPYRYFYGVCINISWVLHAVDSNSALMAVAIAQINASVATRASARVFEERLTSNGFGSN